MFYEKTQQFNLPGLQEEVNQALKEVDAIAHSQDETLSPKGIASTIILQATNNITLQDLSDGGLNLAPGAGAIAFSADADKDGAGDFIMEDSVADNIFTNGRDITISGTNLNVGSIDISLQAGLQ